MRLDSQDLRIVLFFFKIYFVNLITFVSVCNCIFFSFHDFIVKIDKVKATLSDFPAYCKKTVNIIFDLKMENI